MPAAPHLSERAAPSSCCYSQSMSTRILIIDDDTRLTGMVSDYLGGAECPLTSYQFALLDALAGNAGRVMSRDALMDLTKGEQLEAFDRSVDVHISRIRAAIEDDPKKPRRIITIRGAGYVFAKEQDR